MEVDLRGAWKCEGEKENGDGEEGEAIAVDFALLLLLLVDYSDFCLIEGSFGWSFWNEQRGFW